MSNGILIGGSDAGQIFLDPRYANRHGLIAGATGTGKTVTLQCLAEGFSDLGIPVFMADVKGDISGINSAGQGYPHARATHTDTATPLPRGQRHALAADKVPPRPFSKA